SEQQSGRTDKFDDLIGGGKGTNIQSEMEVLKSRGLMTRVVQKQNLQYNYYVVGKIKKINIYKTGPFIIQHEELADSLNPFTLKIRFNSDNTFKVNDDNVSVPFGKRFKNRYGTFRLIRNPLSGISKDYIVEYTPTNAAAGRFASAVVVNPKTT